MSTPRRAASITPVVSVTHLPTPIEGDGTWGVITVLHEDGATDAFQNDRDAAARIAALNGLTTLAAGTVGDGEVRTWTR